MAKNPIDIIDEVTRKYIEHQSRRLLDNIFSYDPSLQWFKEEPEDPFTEWARKVRADAGIIDPPRERIYRGGSAPVGTFVYGTAGDIIGVVGRAGDIITKGKVQVQATNFGTVDKKGKK